ncbi:MAG: glycoside hydrolase [Candidatus Dadabacteria bacterium]
MNKRYVCIHGHFYQPPRESPWLEEIEVEDPAYPYHDWNQRITVECYGPNAASRILNREERILEIVNNYSKISFNFGPTLLSWMEKHEPQVYQQIIEADKISQKERGGHGNAIAQCYNHIIMPLASKRDKATQVSWGIRDFEMRFGRKPEGMWLPETAVDIETLGILSDQGIKFTILSPHQAYRIRLMGESKWTDVSGGKVDTKYPYRVSLGGGKFINVFFYHDSIARAVAFEGLLGDGEKFASRLIEGFDSKDENPQILNIATDGETYGHHHRFGDMALAYALKRIEENGLVKITNYGEHIEKFPPQYEAEILENTSWSCVHGIERWCNNCGCKTGGEPSWNQMWRRPLRDALNWLKDEVDLIFEKEGGNLFNDVWESRDGYIDVILDRSREGVEKFFRRFKKREFSDVEKVTALKLLEMERQALLSFTSCGWFFSDISGIETVQILKYAARTIQITIELTGIDLETRFLDMLSLAPSNIPDIGNGRAVYENLVKPYVVDLKRAIAHYAITSLFREHGKEVQIFSFDFQILDYQKDSLGAITLLVGRTRVQSKIVLELTQAVFGVLYFGGYDFRCSIKGFLDLPNYERLKGELFRMFISHSITEVIRAMDVNFTGDYYTLKDLFIDERRKIAESLLESTISRYSDIYERIYEENRKLMHFLWSINTPIPAALKVAVEFALNCRISQAVIKLVAGEISIEDIGELALRIREEENWLGCKLSWNGLKEALEKIGEKNTESVLEDYEPKKIEDVLRLIEFGERLKLNLDIWRVQNLFWRLIDKKALPTDGAETIFRLGERLRFSRSAIESRLSNNRGSNI